MNFREQVWHIGVRHTLFRLLGLGSSLVFRVEGLGLKVQFRVQGGFRV
jgi:hypothetical protein